MIYSGEIKPSCLHHNKGGTVKCSVVTVKFFWDYYTSNIFHSIVFQKQTTHVKGQRINYIKTGNGKQTLLCCPGALGTIWSDFKPQITDLDKSKFTIVAWDPPGYGFSRPPKRNFSLKFYENDADAAYDFMIVSGF